METVYIETSVISYLVADPSRDLVTAANQQVTRDWWQRRRAGRFLPQVCTPLELMGESPYEDESVA